MTTLISRIEALIADNPPGKWFPVTDNHMHDIHRLQIAVSQVARKLGVRIVTRRHGCVLMACQMMTEEQIAEAWRKETGNTIIEKRVVNKNTRGHETEKRLMQLKKLLGENGHMTPQSIANQMGVCINSARSYCRRLLDRGEIERHKASGEWSLK